jgi:hypothetical protein
MKQKKHESNLSKTILLGSIGLFAGLAIGEYSQPMQTIKEKKIYHNRSVEDNTPQDFFNYTTKTEINDKGRVELYFGNSETGEFLRVNEDGTVGSLGDLIDNRFSRFSEKSKTLTAPVVQGTYDVFSHIKNKTKSFFNLQINSKKELIDDKTDSKKYE